MPELTLKAKAGKRDYSRCAVSVEVPREELPDSHFIELMDETGLVVPGQLEPMDGKLFLHWIIPSILHGEEKLYTVRPGESIAEEMGGGVVLGRADDSTVEVIIGGEVFTAYHCDPSWHRPFLHPLLGPTGAVTRYYPMEDNIEETDDHSHHQGCWIGWGDVNGHDVWSDSGGRIIHREFLAMQGGPVFARLITQNDWMDPDGNKLMEEHRTLRFYNQPAPARAFDMEVKFIATEGPVRFGDTKEGGVCCIRVATSMDVYQHGEILNSYGAINESEAWGKRAQWVDYSGPVSGQVVGVSVMAHPKNQRHPNYWHVRDYGLVAANPFGYATFNKHPDRDGSYNLAQDDTLTFGYRVLVHAGNAHTARVAERYHHYVNPPTVTID